MTSLSSRWRTARTRSFAQSLDRSGYARGTLAARVGMRADVPPLDPRPLLTMMDMGMAEMPGMNVSLPPAVLHGGRHVSGRAGRASFDQARKVVRLHGKPGLLCAALGILGRPLAAHVPPDPPQHPMEDLPYSIKADVMQMNDRAYTAMALLDQLEWRNTADGNAAVWDAQAWYGGDYNQVWLKTEGTRVGLRCVRPRDRSASSVRSPPGASVHWRRVVAPVRRNRSLCAGVRRGP
jgi:FtsP/CotA-like multicopper oxidase with cupredoxin domain